MTGTTLSEYQIMERLGDVNYENIRDMYAKAVVLKSLSELDKKSSFLEIYGIASRKGVGYNPEGTSLRQLEKRGLVIAEEDVGRKLFSLTDKGKKILDLE